MTDDFTNALLHHLQDARTTPSGGWLNLEDLRSLMGLSVEESRKHLGAPITELFKAGLIEKRFNAVTVNDEVRSRGTKPDIRHSVAHPAEEAGLMHHGAPATDFTVSLPRRAGMDTVLNMATAQLRDAGAHAQVMGHFAFRLGYHGRDVALGVLSVQTAVDRAAHDAGVGVIWT